MIQPKKIIAAILLILGSIFGGYQVADDVFFDNGTLVTEDYTILKPADFTRPIQADINLQGKFFTDNVSRELYVHDQTDRIVISSGNEHYIGVVIKINYNVLLKLDKFNGNEIRVMHRGSNGLIDSEKVVSVKNKDAHGFVYIVADFSEVIIDGYVGTWEVTAYNLSVSDSLNLGQTFNASNVTSLSVNVTDDATKSHPYDINYSGCVLDLRFDDDYLDSSGYGNNGTAHGSDIHFNHGKYNNGSVLNGVDDYVDCGNDSSLNITDAITIEVWVTPNAEWTNHDIILRKIPDTGELPYSLDIKDNHWRGYITFTDETFSIVEDTSILVVGRWDNIIFSYDGQYTRLFVNGILKAQSSLVSKTIKTSSLNAVLGGSTTNNFNGTIDSVRIYNRALSAEEIQHNYYDHLQQLRIKTNSNSTWSPEWNSSADNPIQVPYTDGEFFSLLNFTVPETVVQNGITIYDNPSTVRFDAVATVGYTKDITKITEEAAAGTYTYTLYVTHAAGNTGEGYINYTTANSVLLDADFWNSAVLTTDNPNATLSSTLPYFNISTGYVAATTEFYYLVEMFYFYPPTGLTAINGTDNVSLDWDDMQNRDNYSVYQDNAFIINVTASNYTVTGLTPATEYNMSVTTWNGSQQTSKAYILALTNTTSGIFVNPDFVGDEGKFVNKWRTR